MSGITTLPLPRLGFDARLPSVNNIQKEALTAPFSFKDIER